LWALFRATVKKGIDIVQRQNHANFNFQFRKSETCGGDIEKKEVELVSFLPSPFFPPSWRVKGLGGLLERSLFPVIKLALPHPQSNYRASSLEPSSWPWETPFCKQWVEGKESNAFANGVDDFLNASPGLVP
jgi:hypothetical protein